MQRTHIYTTYIYTYAYIHTHLQTHTYSLSLSSPCTASKLSSSTAFFEWLHPKWVLAINISREMSSVCECIDFFLHPKWVLSKCQGCVSVSITAPKMGVSHLHTLDILKMWRVCECIEFFFCYSQNWCVTENVPGVPIYDRQIQLKMLHAQTKSTASEKLRFLCILRHKFKLRFWSYLNLYRGFRVLRVGGFRGVTFSVKSTHCANELGMWDILWRIACIYIHIYIYIYVYIYICI